MVVQTCHSSQRNPFPSKKEKLSNVPWQVHLATSNLTGLLEQVDIFICLSWLWVSVFSICLYDRESALGPSSELQPEWGESVSICSEGFACLMSIFIICEGPWSQSREWVVLSIKLGLSVWIQTGLAQIMLWEPSVADSGQLWSIFAMRVLKEVRPLRKRHSTAMALSSYTVVAASYWKGLCFVNRSR